MGLAALSVRVLFSACILVSIYFPASPRFGLLTSVPPWYMLIRRVADDTIARDDNLGL